MDDVINVVQCHTINATLNEQKFLFELGLFEDSTTDK